MTPEQLKASILKYAMQGKLVEQMPEDGTSDDLFCKIKQVSKPNKNVTPIIEEEIPFDIPASWKWCKFGELVDCSMGKTPPRAEHIWWQDDVHWVSISDMNDYGHICDTKEKVSQKALEEKFGGISTKGTLLMSFKLTVGRTSILDIDAVHNEAIISIYPYVDTENYFRDYLFYILPIVTQWGDSKNAIKGKTLNSKSIANLMIPLAPLNELRRIVAKIEKLLPYVDRYAVAYEKLEQFNAKFPEDMKKSILQYAIQGKLVEQRPEEGTGEELYQHIQAEKQRLFKEGKIKKEKQLAEIVEDEVPLDIPESWKWVRLLDVVEEKPANGFSPKGVDYQTAVKNLTLTATTSGYFKADAFKYVDIQLEPDSKYWLKKDDLLIQRSNSRELVGTSCIYTGDDDAFIYPDLMMKLRVMNGVDVKYVDYVLKSPLTRNYFSKNASGTSESMPKINQGIVSATLIPLPPLAEQKRIVAKLEEILPLCERLK